MKFNFRRIASVLAGATMITSTVALAAAASFPAPFVQSGTPNVAIVMGSHPAATLADMAATTTISDKLASFVTTGVTTGVTSATGGDFVKLEKSSNKFNLGEDTNDIYNKLTNEELAVVLGDNTYKNAQNSEFDYTQEISLGGQELKWFEDNDFNKDAPVIGFDLASGAHIMNYTLDFSTAAEGNTNFADLKNTELTMLGKTFYISNAQYTSNGLKLTLLDTANSVIVAEGSASTINVGGKNYDVSIVFEDSANVILSVDGVQTNKLQEGTTYNLGNDVYISVKNILYSARDSGINKAEVSIGSGKLVIENGQEVQMNSKDISSYKDAEGYYHKVTGFITNSSTNVNKIVLSWETDDSAWVVPGKDLILPGFETIKLSMGSFVTPETFEDVQVTHSSDSIVIRAPTVDSDNTELNFLYLNDSTSGILGIGKSSTEKLITSSSAASGIVLSFDQSTDKRFVASWKSGESSESHIFQIKLAKDGNSVPELKLTNDRYGDVLIKAGDEHTFGNVDIHVTAANYTAGTASVNITASGSGTVYADRLFTKAGLQINLPVNSLTSSGTNLINLTAVPTTFNAMNFTEADENGNIAAGKSFTIAIGVASDGLSVTSVASSTLSGSGMIQVGASSDKYEGYVKSPLSTHIFHDKSGDQSTLELNYFGTETYGEVYVSEVATAITQGDSNSTTPTSPLGNVVVKDDETAGVASKNWIVVGGSCVNTVAAQLLKGASSARFCGADWQQATGVGTGSFLIQTFSRSNGKIATLVAGYDATDTQNAARALTTKTVDTTAGKKYIGGADLTLTPSISA